MKCRRCKGIGKHFFELVSEKGNIYEQILECSICKGTGEVPDEVVAEIGKTPIHFDDGPPANW